MNSLMINEIDAYLEAIKADYDTYKIRNKLKSDPIMDQMIHEFNTSLHIEEGKKYIKVITGPQATVHSFIVKQDSGKFKKGDILKAASWAAPAKNFARGNILVPASYKNVRWTGA